MNPVRYSYERTKQIIGSIKECSHEIIFGNVEGGSMPAENVKPVEFQVSRSPEEICDTFDAASSGMAFGVTSGGLFGHIREKRKR